MSYAGYVGKMDENERRISSSISIAQFTFKIPPFKYVVTYIRSTENFIPPK